MRHPNEKRLSSNSRGDNEVKAETEKTWRSAKLSTHVDNDKENEDEDEDEARQFGKKKRKQDKNCK